MGYSLQLSADMVNHKFQEINGNTVENEEFKVLALLKKSTINPISPGVLDPGNTPGSRLLFDLETLYMLSEI